MKYLEMVLVEFPGSNLLVDTVVFNLNIVVEPTEPAPAGLVEVTKPQLISQLISQLINNRIIVDVANRWVTNSPSYCHPRL